jgi:hypothetical protein
MKRISLFFLACLIFIGAGCSPSIIPEQAEPVSTESVMATQEPVTLEPAVPSMPTETPVPAFDASTYRDESANFEFDYPSDWSLDPSSQIGPRGAQALLTSPGTTAETLAEGGSRLAITTYLWDPKNDLDAYIAQHKLSWNASGFTILSEEQWTLAGDRRAAAYVITTPEEQSFFMLTIIGDDYLVLSGNGDLNLLSEIAKTLRPIQ